MSEPVPPVDSARALTRLRRPAKAAKAAGAGDRRRRDRREGADTKTAPPEAASSTPFEAQRLGQAGVRRGLRAGATAIEEANAAYLEAEWSGPANRRLPTGLIAREKI